MKITELAVNIARQYFGLPVGGGSQSFLDFQGTADGRSRNLYQQYEGIVFACVNAIAQSIASAEWQMQRLNAQGKLVPTDNHRFLTLINNPNKSLSKFELFFGTAAFYELSGDAFWYFSLGELTKLPKEIYLLHPQRVKIQIDKETGKVIGYKYQRTGADDIPLDLKEVLHFKSFNPDSAYRGRGTVQAALSYIETERHTTNFTRNFFRNNATPRGIATVDTNSSTEFNKFKRKWEQRYSGPGNAGKVAFIRGQDVKFTQLSMGLSDIDMEALRRLTEDSILRMFRIPRALLGFTDDAGLGRGNVETLEYIFSKYNIEPKLKQIDDTMQVAIDRFYPKQQVFIDHTNTIPEDKEAVLAEEKALVDIAITRNQIRKRRNMVEVEGGDLLYTQAMQSEIEGSDKEKGGANRGLPAHPKKVIGTIKITRRSKAPATKDADDDQAEANEKFRQSLDTLVASYETAFEKKMTSFLNKQKERVFSQIEPKKAYDTLFVTDIENADLVAAVEPVIISLTVDAGTLAIEFATGEQLDFEVTQAMRESINNSLGRMAKNFNDETLKALSETLAEGLKEGESIGKLKKRVEEVYKDAKGYRSERLARTETIKGGNYATIEAYRQSGFVTAKVWFTNPGACEFCRSMNGKEVGLDTAFKEVGETVEGEDGGTYAVNYDSVAAPPLHPNCRCTIVPKIEK